MSYFKVKPKDLAQWFRCDNEGLLNIYVDFDAQVVWETLDDVETYKKTIKLSVLHNPIMWMIHRMIIFTLNAREQSNDQVTLKDLVLHGHKVDMARWLVTKINSIKDTVGGINEFGTIVTMIIEVLGIRLEESGTQYLKNFIENDYIRFDTFTQI